ncbi:hypothetical protein EDC26_104231 [Paralcaligenes ureilyticus]|uniref:Uncharacterized protein n=1 Tax=Paralcaligenes ureilyticus TaxID=627131 RepID=A0A4R3M6M7_9BURK|nr:hypothetical protein EDC26_104231 [Paralcaligenes ureilyticus]
MIGENSIYLLWHPAIKRPQASLDMRYRHREFCCCQSSGKSRIRISVHKDEIGQLNVNYPLDSLHCAPCISRMTTASYTKIIGRGRDSKLIKKNRRHVVIKVLPCMEKHLLIFTPFC